MIWCAMIFGFWCTVLTGLVIALNFKLQEQELLILALIDKSETVNERR